MPRATRTTSIKNPGTVIINPLPAGPAAPVIETVTEEKKNFWEEQEVLNTAEGKDYVIYLYRLQPSTLGHKGYIAKFSQPVSQEEIKESFGGYEYRISQQRNEMDLLADPFRSFV